MKSTENEGKKNRGVKLITSEDYFSSTLECINAIGDALESFCPLLKIATTVISEIYKVYDDAKYNLNICDSLMDRVNAAEVVIKTLERRRTMNEEKFKDLEYYKSFMRFIDILEKIKLFIDEVSNLQGFNKFFNATVTKNKFKSLINEFEVTMQELHFTMYVSNEEQRLIDQKKKIEGNIVDNENTLNTVLQEVRIIKKQMETPNVKKFRVNSISPNELSDPIFCNTNRIKGKMDPYILKKVYKGQDVICKPTNIVQDDTEDSQRTQAELAILRKLRDSPNILKFYGISKVDGDQVMVFEYVELGTLKELYSRKDKEISLYNKVQIALDICRGLAFLQSCDILHHDIRCQNIMMTTRLEPKISNFKYSRLVDAKTTNIKHIKEIFHWMAPEKMLDSKDIPVKYTFKCEIFSFGMLLWELSFQKIPYENMNIEQIRNHVLEGKREKFDWKPENPKIKSIQEGLKKIIISAYDNNDDLSSNSNSLSDIYEDRKKYHIPYTLIQPLEAGFEAHKIENHKTAWEIFCTHSDLGNMSAKYWKGHYLSEGYVGEKDLKHACELFKEAADYGIAIAQLDYAFSLLKNTTEFDLNVFIEYLTKAANNGNDTAQFSLGDMYLYGKLNCNIDKKSGIKYLKLAALNNHEKAIKILESLGVDVYDDCS
ncbi:17937_t:CDS:2 [Gigaspora margarita]|uniref:17937_t:CDS:1 n=1 Tax=Gigaspora margarita TaxID=4874 RepID=A0ABN7VGR8_GIGMA|nr:17937_t:CDS:2 [Gigaspora margarita]